MYVKAPSRTAEQNRHNKNRLVSFPPPMNQGLPFEFVIGAPARHAVNNVTHGDADVNASGPLTIQRLLDLPSRLTPVSHPGKGT